MTSPRDHRAPGHPNRAPALRGFLRLWPIVAAIAVLGGLFGAAQGCAGDDSITLGPGTHPPGTCIDNDGDGYGVGCAKGTDCDDGNPSSTFECLCDHESPGCPCDEQGKRIACGQVESQVAGQTVCGMGETVCDGGAWSDCIINNTVTLTTSNKTSPKPQTLGPASACTTNPCDPYCTTFIDDPSGLTNAANGIVETDGGLTLIGNLSVPPAQCSGGTSGSCAHHICETGGYLANGCDDPPPPAPVPTVVNVFSEDFSDNSAGWVVDSQNIANLASAQAEWQIAVPAKASVGSPAGFFEDPATDHTPTADNGVAGTKVGGLITNGASHAYYYIVSPVIDASGGVANTAGTLTFYRFLNADTLPYLSVTVEACNGLANCTTLFANGGSLFSPAYIKDSSWTYQSFTIPSAYLTANLQIRFGIKVSCFFGCGKSVSGWNIDDIDITMTKNITPPAIPGCAASVCALLPSCCDPFGPGWTYNCTNLIPTACGVTCGQVNGICTVCYQDAIDHDGDGFSYAQNDCADCDPNINPGAYDYELNAVDEDCNGVVDDEPANCDTGIAITPDPLANVFDYVHAIDLCRSTTVGGVSWGVLTSTPPLITRADAWPNGSVIPAHTNGAAVLPNLGANVPQKGAAMLSISSGDARRPGDPGYVFPTQPPGGLSIVGDSANYPPGFPQAGQNANGIACPLPNDAPYPRAHDSTALWMKIRVPTNAHSFSFDFFFLSAEYFTELCSDHNDAFVALLDYSGHPYDGVTSNNVSFDNNGNLISVNNTFFVIPGSPFAFNHPKLVGTGFDENYQTTTHPPPLFQHPAGTCYSGVCGGGTDWLQTTVPVTPGETITMQFTVWDTKFRTRDSMALIDNWTWSLSPASLQTSTIVPPPPQVYQEGIFVRDYDVTNVCTAGTVPVWGLWSWTASTPADSQIEFWVQTAVDIAGLASATSYPLQFSNPPWPSSALTGNCSPTPCSGGVAATAAAALSASGSLFDTQGGSTVVDTSLSTLGLTRNNPVVRITSKLKPSSDGLQAPTLSAWNLQVDCVPAE